MAWTRAALRACDCLRLVVFAQSGDGFASGEPSRVKSVCGLAQRRARGRVSLGDGEEAPSPPSLAKTRHRRKTPRCGALARKPRRSPRSDVRDRREQESLTRVHSRASDASDATEHCALAKLLAMSDGKLQDNGSRQQWDAEPRSERDLRTSGAESGLSRKQARFSRICGIHAASQQRGTRAKYHQ